jgi:hypothetical protein
MFPGQPQRIQPFPGLNDVIALRFQQIMKQLHVELIIFDDEYRFHFKSPFSSESRTKQAMRLATVLSEWVTIKRCDSK